MCFAVAGRKCAPKLYVHPVLNLIQSVCANTRLIERVRSKFDFFISRLEFRSGVDRVILRGRLLSSFSLLLSAGETVVAVAVAVVEDDVVVAAFITL